MHHAGLPVSGGQAEGPWEGRAKHGPLVLSGSWRNAQVAPALPSPAGQSGFPKDSSSCGLTGLRADLPRHPLSAFEAAVQDGRRLAALGTPSVHVCMWQRPQAASACPTVLYGLSDETQPGVGDRLLCCFFSVLLHAVPLPGTAFLAAWLDASSSRGSLRLPRPACFDCPESVLRESVGPELLSGLRCSPGHLCSDQSPGPGPGGLWL